ncbi:hypothetical protein BDV96DRAFT_593170 [Lophiotrema nucula]|uniref:Uncharacterized protein n=1 Tax=Lophiotrema nucula TaxID=690887 RepID=A0A6A5ZUA5_9PLEO|nr:hypothetical protein BDV96DRAFT_593170 [Lophiotrema nucula]
MHFNSFLLQAAFASILSHVSADCQLSNKVWDEGNSGQVETDPKICQTMGEGHWTFAMVVSETGVPVFNGDDAMAGITGNYGFAIYDNTCALRGSYDPSDDSNCGTPFVIMENFLSAVLTVTRISTTLGDAYFQFAYGNGLFSINNNHCDCVEAGSGLTGYDYCGCAFPVNGDATGWSKREIEFKA